MIRPALLLPLLLLPCLIVQAGVYRWVDADGRVHFSDRPADATAERLDLHVDAPVSRGADSPVDPPPASAPFPGPYARFEILSPVEAEVLMRGEGRFAVELGLEPALQPGHRLAMVLDGLETVIEAGATRFALDGVAFGPHRLGALIRDEQGVLIARAPTLRFELRRDAPPGEL
ncbi:DUF4124 domain-containing protein [Marichromatium gracile]|uniref:Uncharacterized protein DUF4124 n=1 Tax=Marichromatium gracile TaxID=1048 RepID=A0A4V2WAN1_MARGR|nr:DUF4124 domain-containing protein [Marichromatium gracile]MBK1707540.1 hypothetical protein [Marichromatium gracile]TCW39890.1 uncharacterized protein DUF4124 [Marichromatium gracile]